MNNINELWIKNFSDDLDNVLKESETHSDFCKKCDKKTLSKAKHNLKWISSGMKLEAVETG